MKVRCKAVADDNLGAGFQVIDMDLSNNIRMAERASSVPGVFQLRHTAPLRFRAGSPIDQNTIARPYPSHHPVIARHHQAPHRDQFELQPSNLGF
jgi:hypothetical protein